MQKNIKTMQRRKGGADGRDPYLLITNAKIIGNEKRRKEKMNIKAMQRGGWQIAEMSIII